jgi:hypothetical protein
VWCGAQPADRTLSVRAPAELARDNPPCPRRLPTTVVRLAGRFSPAR